MVLALARAKARYFAVPVLIGALLIALFAGARWKWIDFRVWCARRQVSKVVFLAAVHGQNNGENPHMETFTDSPQPLPAVFTSLARANDSSVNFRDPFSKNGGEILYWTTGRFNDLVVVSVGPDRVIDCPKLTPDVAKSGLLPYCYDPSNGLVSGGDILMYNSAGKTLGSRRVQPGDSYWW